MLLNAKKTFKRWKILKSFASELFGSISLSIASNKETVKNLCKGATGPFTAFKIFYDFLDDMKEEVDKIIFLLSNPYRIPFPFLKNISHMPDVGHWIHSDAEMNNIYDYVLN